MNYMSSIVISFALPLLLLFARDGSFFSFRNYMVQSQAPKVSHYIDTLYKPPCLHSAVVDVVDVALTKILADCTHRNLCPYPSYPPFISPTYTTGASPPTSVSMSCHEPSEDEPDRRAELRRIMHKRIQQELSGEHAPPGLSGKRPPANAIPAEFPGHGPRDTLEFSIAEASSAVGLVHSDPGEVQRGGSRSDSKAPVRRRGSYPQVSPKSSVKHWVRRLVFRLRAASSAVPPSHDMPPVNQLTPPGAASPQGWHLSADGSQVNRVAAVDVPLETAHSDKAQDDISLLRSWLTTQELAYPDRRPGDTVSHQTAPFAKRNDQPALESEALRLPIIPSPSCLSTPRQLTEVRQSESGPETAHTVASRLEMPSDLPSLPVSGDEADRTLATGTGRRAIQLERESRESQAKTMSEKRGNSPASSISAHLKVGKWRRGRTSDSHASNTTPESPSLADRRSQTVDSRSKSSVPHTSNWRTGKLTARTRQQNPKFPADGYDSYHGRRTIKTYTLPPESWSKWPSYNRAERTASAGLKDRVKPRDFAVTGSSGDGRLFWVTDRNLAESEPIRYSFSSRLIQGVKTGFGNLLGSKTPSASQVKIPAKIKRRHRSSGQLEYPELEILPTEGGYKELRALGRAIESMKNGPPLERVDPLDIARDAEARTCWTQPREILPVPPRPGMTEENRRNEAINMLRPTTDKRKDGPATLAYSVTRHYRESMMSRDTPVSTEHFETPPSRVSPTPSPRSRSAVS
ncbi:hypothetical protein SODALDRAFT_374774 [Sodiomyces alkalinus F11]|uniref:Uncharacterized protein n=1 Tax=Sodiomyces alkalinus (strain CBS 110278 / VKM F-3762 / F11) TaxID=1314773 RepID=A0A3N2Q6R6_SODAK|nr:hypothetical protein SODALDRAFT_374774 [Sodiomyces alkalinus F11]ROT42442.1 hypothetical protein SODALDRAFT_374774 [Sodiomyces alkalinus F11]